MAQVGSDLVDEPLVVPSGVFQLRVGRPHRVGCALHFRVVLRQLEVARQTVVAVLAQEALQAEVLAKLVVHGRDNRVLAQVLGVQGRAVGAGEVFAPHVRVTLGVLRSDVEQSGALEAVGHAGAEVLVDDIADARRGKPGIWPGFGVAGIQDFP